MNETRHSFQSALGPYINGLLEEKRAHGYKYEFEEYILGKFDEYWIYHGFTDAHVTRDRLADWMNKRENECAGYHSQRISFIRQLFLYMNSLGILTYVPGPVSPGPQAIVHVPSVEEVAAFFRVLDDWPVYMGKEIYATQKYEYQIMFRFIYSCGLRFSEACGLRTSCVDFAKGIVTIRGAKNDRDRLVFLPEDLRQDFCDYNAYIRNFFEFEPVWFFPSIDPQKSIHKTTVANKFNKIWSKTPYADSCDRKPTTHCLRHAMIVRRMNLWMDQGIDLNVMLPYLSKFLGHSSPSETFYYYHVIQEAFRIIRKKDKKADAVISEVLL